MEPGHRDGQALHTSVHSSGITKGKNLVNVSAFPLAVGCVDPPKPAPESNLRYDYDAAVNPIVAIGSSVTYSCNTGEYFESEYGVSEHRIECAADGTWSRNELNGLDCKNPSGS